MEENSKNREKAIERAKKLMAMAADSSSPHEAAIAARRARAIMDKYQLELDDLKEAAELDVSVASDPRQRIPQWEKNIAIFVALMNDCQVRIIRGCFVFAGFAEDVEACRFMFHYITENGKRCCTAFMRIDPLGSRDSFKSGYSGAIVDKIKAIIEARKSELATGDGKSLVVVKQAIVEERFGSATYKEKTCRKKIDVTSYSGGVAAGKRTNIVTGLNEDHKQPLNMSNA